MSCCVKPLVAALLLLGGAIAGIPPIPVRGHQHGYHALSEIGGSGGQPIDPGARLTGEDSEWHSQLPLPPRFLLTNAASTDSTINITRPLEGSAWTVGEFRALLPVLLHVLHHVPLAGHRERAHTHDHFRRQAPRWRLRGKQPAPQRACATMRLSHSTAATICTPPLRRPRRRARKSFTPLLPQGARQ